MKSASLYQPPPAPTSGNCVVKMSKELTIRARAQTRQWTLKHELGGGSGSGERAEVPQFKFLDSGFCITLFLTPGVWASGWNPIQRTDVIFSGYQSLLGMEGWVSDCRAVIWPTSPLSSQQWGLKTPLSGSIHFLCLVFADTSLGFPLFRLDVPPPFPGISHSTLSFSSFWA